MRQWIWRVAFVVALAAPAWAEPRIALVVGNGAYDAKLGTLANPAGDAKAVAGALRKAGFDVDLQTNLDQKSLKRAISRLGERLRTAGTGATGLFYYGGHGLQAKGENFLIPIKADIQAEADLDIEAVPAAGVLRQMEDAGNAVNIVILDACRNTVSLSKTRGAATRGLARMDAPKGSFIAYSTAPGEVAQDGNGAHSPFATALVEGLGTPQPIDRMFIDVRRKVLAATDQRQTPWTSSSLVNEFYFLPPASDVAPLAAAPASMPAPPPAKPTAKNAEIAYWESVNASNDIEQLRSYLARYPKGTFVGLARTKIKELSRSRTIAVSQPQRIQPSANALEELRRTVDNANVADNKARTIARQARAAEPQAVKQNGSGYQVNLFALVANAAKGETTDGVGVKNWKNGDAYAGELRGGRLDGFGLLEGGPASPIREAAGQFSDGALNGYATVRYKDGTVSKGAWQNDRLSGYGVRFDIGGHPVEQGFFRDGELVGSGP